MTNVDAVLDAFREMTLLELTDFRKKFETEFGVTGESAVVVAPSDVVPVEEVEEQTEFDVVLDGVGEKKIQVIKVVRELTKLGLKEAKDLVDAAPKPVLSQVPKDVADHARDELVKAGASVSVV